MVRAALLGAALVCALATVPASPALAQTKGDAIGDLIKDVVTPRPKPKRTGGKIAAKRLFGAKKIGARLKPAAYGYYTRGCLAGAEQLEETGPAWQAMRDRCEELADMLEADDSDDEEIVHYAAQLSDALRRVI